MRAFDSIFQKGQAEGSQMDQLSDAFDLSGKVALVTGGASGIGAGIAEILANAGATVVIADRDSEGAQKQVAALTEAGGQAGAAYVDLADETSIVSA